MNKVAAFDFKFTKGSAQKYKGKWGLLGFCLYALTWIEMLVLTFIAEFVWFVQFFW